MALTKTLLDAYRQAVKRNQLHELACTCNADGLP